MGDGGAILTASAEYADSARMLRDYGQRARYRHEIIGYNSRLDELQAAYLSEAFLPRLVGWLERRRAIALRYCHEIRNPEIEVPGAPEGSYSCWHLFPIAVDPEKKPLLLDHFRSNGVQTGEHYPVALIEQPVLQMYTVDCGSDCRNAVRFCHSEVSLPIHPYLTDDEVSVVIDVANSWSA
jgi:dTDP-3-amino-3,4,6-trideoxy-alpha-D-glucose transaminase